MFFSDLRDTFLNSLRAGVCNGETTERSLARLVGVSQPHMHNVLKGTRTLTPELMDRFLYHKRLSVLDLVDSAAIARHLDMERPNPALYSYLPVVKGSLGPGHAWPTAIEAHERFPVAVSAARRMWHPVVAKLGVDLHMHPLFGEGDMALLDQSHQARTEFDDDALYVIKKGRAGQVRRIRVIGPAVYAVSEDCLARPGLWERLPVEGQHKAHFVRARATLLAREQEWA
ncbi:MAG: hypothetical protein H7Y20_18935 [Bryobacteraceae bacterium]|nr:hypothetical protein [Bryobacteraceae bacterium]